MGNGIWQVSYDAGGSWVDWPRKPDPERDAGLAMARVRHVTDSGSDYCLQSPDHQHCDVWFDGGQCHYCGAGAMTTEERSAQGMENDRA